MILTHHGSYFLTPCHHALGKFPEFFTVLNTLVKPFERMSTLHLFISLLILSEYAAFFVFIFFAAFNISSIVISVSSRFFEFYYLLFISFAILQYTKL